MTHRSRAGITFLHQACQGNDLSGIAEKFPHPRSQDNSLVGSLENGNAKLMLQFPDSCRQTGLEIYSFSAALLMLPAFAVSTMYFSCVQCHMCFLFRTLPGFTIYTILSYLRIKIHMDGHRPIGQIS